MDEVKITIKPTDEVLAKANEEHFAVDARGRKIRIKKPGVLAQYRLIEALGDLASNVTYRTAVMPLTYVAGIDDVVIHQPKNKLQVEALIQHLDEDGIEAVMAKVVEVFGETDPEKDKDDLKK